MAKKDNNYFKMFMDIAADAITAATHLKETINNYDPEKIHEQMLAMHEVEHAADNKKHQMMEKLIAEFITPIEREDIITLSWALDDVLDYMEEIYQILFMHNVKSMREEALVFGELIYQSTVALKTCFDEFEHFKRSKILPKRLIEVNAIEEKADKLYIDAVRRLHLDESDPSKVHTWSVLFLQLERTIDRIEQVADTIELVIMKNS
ncbi:MAG TPA: DUF47 family protein [Anaerolineaceae bacterium]|nr:DUF47 family protein [Anaerolineaceae bacterium]HQN69365.1 DUF47 family protein [Anaerolineaceae bacterium]